MQTYSHLILTAALSRPTRRLAENHEDRLPPYHTKALLFGSILPDLPLITLSVVVVLRDLVTGVFSSASFAATQPGSPLPPELLEASMTMKLFEVWFFENPWVIMAQNLFHSPILVLLFIIIAYVGWQRDWQRNGWFFWMLCAAMLHTLIDIPLHVTDGPLLLFPLDWNWRFQSPISYWDPNYYGREWTVFEHLLDLVLLIYLAVIYRQSFQSWWRQRRIRRHGTL